LRQRIERRFATWGSSMTHRDTETKAQSWTCFYFQLRLPSTSSRQESRPVMDLEILNNNF
jgi:hypothetical protein